MRIRIVVEPIEPQGFRAKATEPFSASAEAGSREESVQKLRDLLRKQISQEEPLELLEINPSHPWAGFAGTLDPNDPMVQEWEEIMKENRRRADDDPDYL
jgi:hypothetical protein